MIYRIVRSELRSPEVDTGVIYTAEGTLRISSTSGFLDCMCEGFRYRLELSQHSGTRLKGEKSRVEDPARPDYAPSLFVDIDVSVDPEEGGEFQGVFVTNGDEYQWRGDLEPLRDS